MEDQLNYLDTGCTEVGKPDGKADKMSVLWKEMPVPELYGWRRCRPTRGEKMEGSSRVCDTQRKEGCEGFPRICRLLSPFC